MLFLTMGGIEYKIDLKIKWVSIFWESLEKGPWTDSDEVFKLMLS
jgi:hypothetical protein